MKNTNIINIAAAIITNPLNEILLVRKTGSCFFMQAGGKLEPTETPEIALIRELQEELQLKITPNQLHYLGQYSAKAANEKNHHVNAHLFSIDINKKLFVPNAELVEVGWFTIAEAKNLTLAPLTKDIILPIIVRKEPTQLE